MSQALLRQAMEALEAFNLKEDMIVAGQAGALILRVPLEAIQKGAAALSAISSALEAGEEPVKDDALPVDGWLWMTHPTHHDGKPIPVWTYVQFGVRYYTPFDPTACNFEWDERDSEWKIVASPVPADTQGDAKDAARYRWLRSIDGNGAAAFEIDANGDPVWHGILVGGHLDDFIDAALSTTPEAGKK